MLCTLPIEDFLNKNTTDEKAFCKSQFLKLWIKKYNVYIFL